MRTIHLKKPTYIGTGAQVAAIRAENSADGTFSEKKTAGRIAAGLYLKGKDVAITRLGGRRILIPADEAQRQGVEIENVATLASVDRNTGEVLLALS